MCDCVFVLSDQNGHLVGHISFQEKKYICSPETRYSLFLLCGFIQCNENVRYGKLKSVVPILRITVC